MDTVDVRFAQALRELRKSKGLTQEALAQRAGVDYKYLQKLEGSKPSSPTLICYLVYFGIANLQSVRRKIYTFDGCVLE